MSEGTSRTSCYCDPLTQLLRQTFHKIITLAFESDSQGWDEVKRNLASETDLADLRDLFVEGCVLNFNTKLLLTHGFHEMTRNQRPDSSQQSSTTAVNNTHPFPSIFIDHYNVRESIGYVWKNKVLRRYPTLKDCPVPEICINLELSESLAKTFSNLKINPAASFSWPTAAPFQVDPKEVADLSIKWTLNQNHKKCHHTAQAYNVEFGLSEGPDGPEDAKVLLAQCVSNLFNTLGYSETKEVEYNVIPTSFQIQNVLVVLESFQDSNPPENSIVFEMDPTEFYTKYSDAVVVLYNFARVNSILERYQSLVAEDVACNNEENPYPKLLPLDQVDFTAIPEAKEEFPIIFLLFLWPAVLRSVVNTNRRGSEKINLSFMFDFIKTFAKSFDAFYNKVVVIVPRNATHNFASMTARIYLLQAIAKVFDEFMQLAGIELEKLPSSSKKNVIPSDS